MCGELAARPGGEGRPLDPPRCGGELTRYLGMIWRWPVIVAIAFLAVVLILAVLHLIHFGITFSIG